jgi:Family of unknown function (DUF5681)
MSRELTQFKPGAEWNGNRAGRPKGGVSLTTLLKNALEETRCADVDNPGGRTSAQCLVEAVIIHAVKGNAAFMREIFDRVDGKIPDPAPPEPEVTMEEVAKRLREIKKSRRKKSDAGPR